MTQRYPRLALALVAVAAIATALPAGADPGKGKGPKNSKAAPAPAFACTGNPEQVRALTITVGGTRTFGYYALPRSTARGLVVFAHGYGHTVESWRRHLSRTARELGVIAVAMENRGQLRTPPSKPGGLPGSRGWQVQEGAEDSNAAAQFLERTCRVTGTNVMYGISMGGNTSGLALAMQPKRSNGKPLYDYWVAVEGAHNVIETYHEAALVAKSGNAYAMNAAADIEREMGGTYLERRAVYEQRTVVNRIDDIVGSGIKGVQVVHGVADGLVPYNQSRELVDNLRAAGMPVHFWTYTLRSATSEAGTTIDGYIPVPHDSPFAGHASEASETHDVGKRGFAALAQLYQGPVVNGETLVTRSLP